MTSRSVVTLCRHALSSRSVVAQFTHLGIVAESCRESGGTDWRDQQEPGHRQRVSVGTATGALVPNGLGFSTRRRSLVSPFCATKPVAHLVGPGITADQRTA